MVLLNIMSVEANAQTRRAQTWFLGDEESNLTERKIALIIVCY